MSLYIQPPIITSFPVSYNRYNAKETFIFLDFVGNSHNFITCQFRKGTKKEPVNMKHINRFFYFKII